LRSIRVEMGGGSARSPCGRRRLAPRGSFEGRPRPRWHRGWKRASPRLCTRPWGRGDPHPHSYSGASVPDHPSSFSEDASFLSYFLTLVKSISSIWYLLFPPYFSFFQCYKTHFKICPPRREGCSKNKGFALPSIIPSCFKNKSSNPAIVFFGINVAINSIYFI